MKIIKGKYSEAVVYTDIINDTACDQIKMLCDLSFTEGCKIRIMPDAHAGASCVIGFTADLGDKVIPNIVGVDIGCGMLTVKLGKIDIDYARLDAVIREFVPAGQAIHENEKVVFPLMEELHCFKSGRLKNKDLIRCSLGTLGGGNHFIEVDEDDEGEKYLVIHTGSRNLGAQVARIFQQQAIDDLIGCNLYNAKRLEVVEDYKSRGMETQIPQALAEFAEEWKKREITIPEEYCYLTGEMREKYLHDMDICQQFAELNRLTIADIIIQNLFGKNTDDFEWFQTIHNYVDMETKIIRKGAVSAKKDELLLIPINMRDGSLICIGKGNEEWNCSAPHGAGRLYSRSQAKSELSMESYKKSMEGIYTTSVSLETLDECPQAYKPIESILENIVPTVDVLKIIRPVYNFKAGDLQK